MHAIRQIEINGLVSWQFKQDSTSARLIAICDPLGLTVEADSHQELRENIEETMQLVMRSMLKSGDLDNFLRERGWTVASPAQQAADEEVVFDVPIELIAARANGDKKTKLYQ
jgi:hypothetical protein